jgi:hypothetical protein
MTDKEIREPVRLHTGFFHLSNNAVNPLAVHSISTDRPLIFYQIVLSI